MAYEKGPVLLREIAERQEISVRYLERLMTDMVRAGLIRSMRGQKGGFQLAQPPYEIRLSRVIEAVEGPITPVDCVDSPQLCHRHADCVTHDIWIRLKNALVDVLDDVTLADMLQMQMAK